jgi:hypothetical protein
VDVSVDRDVDAIVLGDLITLPRPNTVELAVNGQARAAWALAGTRFDFVAVTSPVIGLHRGRNVLRFSSRQPATSLPADPRPLAFGVSNLTIRIEPTGRPCELQR